jgi:hypothetical protein
MGRKRGRNAQNWFGYGVVEVGGTRPQRPKLSGDGVGKGEGEGKRGRNAAESHTPGVRCTLCWATCPLTRTFAQKDDTANMARIYNELCF